MESIETQREGSRSMIRIDMLRQDTRHPDKRRRHQGRASCEIADHRFETVGPAPIYKLATLLWLRGHGGAAIASRWSRRSVLTASRARHRSALAIQEYGVAFFGGHASSGGSARGFKGRTRAEVKEVSVRYQKR